MNNLTALYPVIKFKNLNKVFDAPDLGSSSYFKKNKGRTNLFNSLKMASFYLKLPVSPFEEINVELYEEKCIITAHFIINDNDIIKKVIRNKKAVTFRGSSKRLMVEEGKFSYDFSAKQAVLAAMMRIMSEYNGFYRAAVEKARTAFLKQNFDSESVKDF